MKLGFIGVGNMGEAVLRGVVNEVGNENIIIRNSTNKSTENVANHNRVIPAKNLKELAQECEVIFIGVKPYLVANILEEIKEEVCGKIIISMAASVEINDIKNIINTAKIVRIMPNTPVEVGAGVVGVSFEEGIKEKEQHFVLDLLKNLGQCVVIVEKDMAALTALSGSGPAYAYLFIEALADGAVLNGLKRDVAYNLAANTLIGAAKMILKTNSHPAKLKDDVCSPGGSTIEALRILEEKNFRSAVIECEKACYDKLNKM